MIQHLLFSVLFFCCFASLSCFSDELRKGAVVESVVCFTPPVGWQMADPSQLPPCVKWMVVGKGPSFFPPSLNLSTEPYKGSVKAFLKRVRQADEERGYIWKDLGPLRTDAGIGSLIQVDMPSEWGEKRSMQLILVKNGQLYILNATALKEEFALFYKEFFAAMRSLHILKDPIEMLPLPNDRVTLRKAIETFHSACLKDPSLQEQDWKLFQEWVEKTFPLMSQEWRNLLFQTVQP